MAGENETPLPSAPAPLERRGPAARARAEGRSYDVKILRSAMTPYANPDGTLRSGASPYLPILDACALCPARCCKLNVKISLFDAVHYTTTLDLPFFAGLTLVPSTHETHAFRVERDPRVSPDPDGWTGKAEIQLRRRADGSCHALVDIGGYERCSVYAARPSICRLYPFSWTSEVAKGSPGFLVCPVPFAVTPAVEAEAMKSIERSIEGWELHDDVVAEWNQRDLAPEARTVEAFLGFAIPRTAELMGTRHAPALEKGTSMERLYQAMLRSGVVRPKR